MTFCETFCINKSGKPYKVYDALTGTLKGTIYNRESFIHTANEGTLDIITFLNSSGQLETVNINNYNYPYDYGFRSPCTDYPYSTEVINGTEYRVFKMRKTKNIYTAAANYWGQVAAGMYVATNSDEVGSTHQDWKLINYVKSSSGQWVAVNGDGYNHGFVDTGLASASGYGSIAFYGSW